MQVVIIGVYRIVLGLNVPIGRGLVAHNQVLEPPETNLVWWSRKIVTLQAYHSV